MLQSINKKVLKFAFKLLISSGLVLLLIFKIDWGSFFSLLSSVSLWWVVAYVLMYVASTGVSGYKWKLIAEFVSLRMSLLESYKRYITGAFINTFLPSTIGGDTYRTLSLAGKVGSKKDAVATVVADRISGLVITMFLGVIFGFANEVTRSNEWFLGVLYLMVLALLGLSALFVLLKTKIVKNAYHHFPEFLKSIISSLKAFKNREAFFSMGLWSAIFAFAGPAVMNYLMFLAFGIDMNIMDYLAVVFVANVIIALPISVGNIGLKEWAYITLFGMFGISASQAVAVVLLGRFLMMAVNATALPMYLKEKK